MKNTLSKKYTYEKLNGVWWKSTDTSWLRYKCSVSDVFWLERGFNFN